MVQTSFEPTVAVERFNRLLRGELSAIATYRQARDQIGPMNGGINLRELQDDHIAAANAFSAHIRELGGAPAEDSGVWGAFATVVESTAKLFGSKAALKALKEGEEHGIKEFHRALEDEHLGAICRRLIRERLPLAERHVAELDRLMVMQI